MTELLSTVLTGGVSRRLFALGVAGIAAGLVVARSQGAGAATSAPALQSAGALAFGPDNVLFVGDIKGAAVHAFVLGAGDITSQKGLSLGNTNTFEGRDLISRIDKALADALGTSADQITINDMVVHPPSGQIFLSVQRGFGPEAMPAIMKVNDGVLEMLDTDRLAHSAVSLSDLPAEETLEFGQPQRSLAITDISYYQGEIFVSGVTNEEFASTLRRIAYPFNGAVSTSTTETWHTVHGEFETRAPIMQHMVRELGGVPYLIAVYTCTPLVRIPLSALRDGAHVRSEMIGEMGFGNTPLDLLGYTDPFDHKDYVLITNTQRGAMRVAMDDIAAAPLMPVNVPPNFGPAGISQVVLPLTGAQQIDLIDAQWAAVVRRNPLDDRRLDLHTLPVPFFFDRADDIVEMNWPNGPDPFGYRKARKL